MTITVRFFALLRDRAGTPQLRIDLPPGATVRTALAALVERFPNIEPALPRTACAVNMTKVDPDAPLRDGDELALLPPVSGG